MNASGFSNSVNKWMQVIGGVVQVVVLLLKNNGR